MKIHLAWIRMTAAAAIAAGVGVHPAAAQYAPMRPIPQQPAVQPVQPAAAPTTPYVAYRTQPTYPQPTYPQQQQAYPQTQVPPARYQAPVTTYQAPAAPAAAYQQPTAYQQAPATQYRQQPPVAYPQTAMAQYPVAYGGTPYVAQQPTEALPAPVQQSTAGAAPAPENMPGGAMPVGDQMAPTAGVPSGYPAAGCNCNSGYSAGQYYGAGGAGACGAYPSVGCMDDCGPENIWFGGVYFLYMTRESSDNVRLTTEIETGSVAYPYYPTGSTTVVSSQSLNSDFTPGVEVRLGSTISIGDDCSAASCGCGNGYTGCGGCNSCSVPTTYAWEVAWWGLDNDTNDYVRQDTVDTRLYGMKSFAGIEYDRESNGNWMPVNSYYDYQMPIDPQPGDTIVLAQRVYTNFRAQNLEVNILRFPMTCDTCSTGCGGDACGCGGNYTGCNSDCGCDTGWKSNFSMYGACGVRYFRIDDDFGYDTDFNVDGGGHTYDGFSGMPDLNELCYDVNVDNNLIGPQVGWTTNYCVGCRWNFFCNSTFGVFNNQMNQTQRVWGSGDVQFVNSGENVNVRSSKNDIAFLGELRVGGSYDISCNWRAVLAYRAIGLSGIATSVGQIPDNFSNRADVAQIDSDSSMIIHGVQTGIECRY